MKFLVGSDFHVEFDKDGGTAFFLSLPTRDVDVLVVAGDLCTWPMLEGAMDTLCSRFPAVVYVPGNHEMYFLPFPDLAMHRARLSEKYPNLHWLYRSHVTIQDVRIAGCTLWPDPSHQYEREMDMGRMLSPKSWMISEHRQDISFLARVARDRSADVIVTHFVPHASGIAPRWRGQDNWYFHVPVDGNVETCGARIVVSGHTHDPCDVDIAPGTRLVINPRGYPSEGRRERYFLAEIDL